MAKRGEGNIQKGPYVQYFADAKNHCLQSPTKVTDDRFPHVHKHIHIQIRMHIHIHVHILLLMILLIRVISKRGLRIILLVTVE